MAAGLCLINLWGIANKKAVLEDRVAARLTRIRNEHTPRQPGEDISEEVPEQSQPFWYKPINRRTNIREGSRLALGALAVTGILGPGGIVYAKQRSEAMDAPPVNLFNELIKQYIDESLQRRAERAKKDSEYAKRVDPELNEDRVNILLFGYGKEHGDTYQDYGGSMSILSYDLRTGQVAIVSFSRDIRAPEVEQRLEPLVPPGKRQPVTVRKVYKAGGFTLMQEIAEKMTGLAVDYQVVLKDVVVANAIEQLAGGFWK